MDLRYVEDTWMTPIPENSVFPNLIEICSQMLIGMRKKIPDISDCQKRVFLGNVCEPLKKGIRYRESLLLLSFIEIKRNCEGLLRHLTELTGSIMANDSVLTDETVHVGKNNVNYSYTFLASKLT